MITQLLLATLIGLAFGIFAAAMIYSTFQLTEAVPSENRDYLDPLPFFLKILWPLVRFVDYYLCRYVPQEWVLRSTKALRLSGQLYLMNASQFFALSLISVTIFVAAGVKALSVIDEVRVIYFFIFGLLGFLLPRIWLNDAMKKRRKEITRALPVYLDFLTMGIEAGLNMNGAISQAVDKGPAGLLRNEFSMVLRDLRAGLTRAEALGRMNDRTQIQQVSTFVKAVVQAERMGASLGDTFRNQAEQRRTERFQLAEKMAMQAPVKLMGPLIAFIFPVTFIVIFFPIVMKFLQSGVHFG